MKKSYFILVLLILMVGTVFATNCPPSIPKVYSGEAFYEDGIFDNLLDDAEYPLRAMMGNDLIGYGSVLGGEYSIKISPCFGSTGDVAFVINGIEATPLGEYAGQEDWGIEESNFRLLFNPKPPKNDTCGDSSIQLGEECDGINLGGRSTGDCGTGWTGTISCSASCEIDYSGCSMSPYCGDGTCNNGETCSSCSGDCGSCSTDTGSSSSSSSSSGSSGGGTPIVITQTPVNNSDDGDDGEQDDDQEGSLDSNSSEEKGSSTNEGFFSLLTGAVTGGGTGAWLIPLIFIIVLIGIAVVVFFVKKK